MKAETLYINANIVTLDPSLPAAEALATAGERVLAVGTRQECEALQSAWTRVIDCRGGTLAPGFNDAHCHYFSSLRKLFSLDLSPLQVRSIQDIQDALRRQAAQRPAGAWIKGTDYNEFYLAEKRHPTRRDLDAAAPDHPVMITHRSLHACVLNSRALQMVGIHNESEEPPGGLIDRDLESGEPNGVLYEMLDWVQARLRTPLTAEDLRWGAAELDRRYLEVGITSFTDATVTNDSAQVESLSGLIRQDLIHSRVNVMLGSRHLADYLKQKPEAAATPARLKTGCAKIVISQATGEMRPDQEELQRTVLEINRAGFQAAIHAVEIDSVAAAVQALEFARANRPGPGPRNRIEHCSECPPELVRRLAQVRAVIVTQPSFLYFQGERYRQEVAPEVQPFLYPCGSLYRAGLCVAGSSDAPVVDNRPLIGIYSAVNRRAMNGEVLLPEERLSPAAALAMYTRNGAAAHGEEAEKGTLAPGQLADMVLLNGNPLTCPPEEIKDLQVEKTVIGGKVVWERDS